MIERLVLVLLFSAVAVGLYTLLRQRHMRQAQPVAAGRPALLYFHADHCPTCPAQGRYVDTAAAGWGERLLVQRVDAERDPETAARYRVFTLPTTVLVDGGGRVRHINYGLTDARKLGAQIASLVELAMAGRQTTDDGPWQEGLPLIDSEPSSIVRRLSSLARPKLPSKGAS